MTARRNPDWLIRAFLDEGPTELPDQVYDAVRDRIEQTRQRVVIGPWRIPSVSRFLAFGVAAAAVVLAVFIGLQVLGGSNVGGPSLTDAATPTPLPTQPPSPTPSPVPTPAAEIPPAGPLAIGRHTMTLGGVRLSIEIPTDGWISNGQFGIDKGNFELDTPDAAGFIFWTHSAADNVYADPCARTPLSPPAGPSAAELAAAVSTVPGIALVSGPSEVSVGGYPAQHVVVTVPEDIGCAPSDFHLWYDADTPGDARYATALNSTIYVWIIDVDGTLVWIDGETYATSSPEAAQEVQQIIDSIVFE